MVGGRNWPKLLEDFEGHDISGITSIIVSTDGRWCEITQSLKDNDTDDSGNLDGDGCFQLFVKKNIDGKYKAFYVKETDHIVEEVIDGQQHEVFCSDNSRWGLKQKKISIEFELPWTNRYWNVSQFHIPRFPDRIFFL